MLADYHVHTIFSDDSEYPMETVVRDAIALGLDEICFTEHVDYGNKRDVGDPRGMLYRPGDVGEAEWMPAIHPDYASYMAEISSLQETYRSRIRLKTGMEFGIQQETIEEFETLFSQYPFDFILLSVHQIGNKELWNGRFQAGKTQEECYWGYYEELLTLVKQYKHYSVLGHLDLISRYDKKGGFPFDPVKPLITEILQTVIADGKGIEVNTSSARYGLKDMTPSREILSLYQDLGGQILTIGSDSHKKAHLGACIAETQRELKAMGFDSFHTFEKMTPIGHRLCAFD